MAPLTSPSRLLLKLPRGSRFGTRAEPCIWYGALTLPTAFAEVAYYRLVFLDGSAAALDTVTVELSAFRAQVRTPRGVDLTAPPFAAHRRRISSKTSYAASQLLGREMRADRVEVALCGSARDRAGGTNVAVLAPAFARRTPSSFSAWVCSATRARVEIAKTDVLRAQRYAFERAAFAVGGALPTPAL